MSDIYTIETDGGVVRCEPEASDGTPRVEMQMSDGDESTVLYLDRNQVMALHAAALNCLGLADQTLRAK